VGAVIEPAPMSTVHSTLFETPLGRCGIAWGARGVVGVQLPEANVARTRARLRERFPGVLEAPPPRAIQTVIRRIGVLLRGGASDLSSVRLDMDGVPPFHCRVYEAARRVPPGSTATYGEIAVACGSPGSARAVGQALRRNPFPIVVPCHRVLAAGGKPGGFTAEGGLETKRRLLAQEVPKAPVGKAVPKAPVGKGVPKAPVGKAVPKAAVAKVAPKAPVVKRAAKARIVKSASTAPVNVVRAAVGKAATPADMTHAEFDAAPALHHLRKRDRVLARVIDAAGPFRLETDPARNVFDALASAIVYQQLTGKAAATIHGRVCALFPGKRTGFTPADILGAPDEALRGAGLSRAKAAALRDLAQKTIDGEIPTLARARRLPDDELVESLTRVRGIGRWTVEMLLMFRLGRPDVLPADDYGVRKGFALTWKLPDLPSRAALLEHGEAWRPWRSVASWYMWRAVDLAKKPS